MLHWGNSYGVRLSKAELEAAGVRPGQEIRITIHDPAGTIDLSGLPAFYDPALAVSANHDRYLAESYRRKSRRRDLAARSR